MDSRSIVQAVLDMPDQDGLPALRKTLRDPAHIKATAAALLKLLKPGPAVLGFGGLFNEKYSVQQRINALHMLRLLESSVDVPTVVRLVGDKAAPVRREAVRLLGAMGLWLSWDDPTIKTVISALRLALNHREDADVRRLAAYSLGKMSAWEATDALVNRLEVEADEAVREETALALGRLNVADGVYALIDAYEAGEIEREVCFEALLRVEGDTLDPLISVASRWNIRLSSRVLAAEALAALQDVEAAASLMAIMERPHEPDDLRVAVAQALAAIGEREAVPMLEAARSDPESSEAVINAASDALAALRGDEQRRLF